MKAGFADDQIIQMIKEQEAGEKGRTWAGAMHCPSGYCEAISREGDQPWGGWVDHPFERGVGFIVCRDLKKQTLHLTVAR